MPGYSRLSTTGTYTMPDGDDLREAIKLTKYTPVLVNKRRGLMHQEGTAAPDSHVFQIVLALIVGALITWSSIYISSNDLLHHWSRMPDLPTPDASIVALRGFTVYAQQPDGTVIAIEPAEQTVWQPVAQIPADTANPRDQMHVRYLGACDRSDQRFRNLADVPHDEVQCLEAITSFGPSIITLSIIRDTHDQLWYFQTGGGPDFNPGGFLIIPCGFVLATLFSYPLIRVIINATRRR